jgi:hypothetical protein
MVVFVISRRALMEQFVVRTLLVWFGYADVGPFGANNP